MPSYVKIERNYNPSILVTRWGRLPTLVIARLRNRLMSYLRYYGLEAIKRYMPKGGTGMLEESIQAFDESTTHAVIIRLGTGNDELDMLLRIFEYGSPPHTITPMQAQALRFKPEPLRFYQGVKGVMPMRIMLDYHFTKRVDHPGNQAYLMFSRGLRDIKPEIISIVNEVLRESINEIAREK